MGITTQSPCIETCIKSGHYILLYKVTKFCTKPWNVTGYSLLSIADPRIHMRHLVICHVLPQPAISYSTLSSWRLNKISKKPPPCCSINCATTMKLGINWTICYTLGATTDAMVTMDKRESLKQLFIKTHTETAWPKVLTDIQDTHTFILGLTLPVLSTKIMEGSISRINLLSLGFHKLPYLEVISMDTISQNLPES